MKKLIKVINPILSQKAESACNRTEFPHEKTGPNGCTEEDHDQADLFKALAHPVRIRILRLISKSSDSLCSCDIESHFPLRQPTISHHMKILKESGLVSSTQEGSWVKYRINSQFEELIHSILRLEKNSD
jgi:DNA-binding transcriptional ArsR family regulator